MKRKTKLALIGAIAVGMAVVLYINLSTPQPASDISELRKPAPDAPQMDGLSNDRAQPDGGER